MPGAFPISIYEFPELERIEIPDLAQRHLAWLDWENQVHNLTRVPREDWLARHVLDSAVPLLAGWSLGDRFLDLGSGPGFPGVPLAAFSPEASGLLLESRKKVADNVEGFLLGAGCGERIRTKAERAEVAGRMAEHRETYCRVVTRAVAALPILIELALPFLRVGGELWCWKSDLTEVETASNAVAELHGEIARALQYQLPGEDRTRFVIAIRKLEGTPEKFPRRSGIPEKRPL